MRKKRRSEDGGFNIWRSYSDMMAGVLLLFVLIMCVTLFQAQKSYDDSLKERLQNVPENRAGSSPLTYHPPLTPPCVPVGTRRFNYILRKETCMTRTAHGFRGMQVFSVLSGARKKQP